MATGRIPTTANSPLTAKGDIFTYSTGSAKLAVGNDGETIVADSSTATGLRWQGSMAAGRNLTINGGFDIWQRNTSVAGGSATTNFSADRWVAYRAVAGSTFSRQVTGDTTNLPNIQYCVRVARDSGNTSTSSIILDQSFETVNSIPFAGQTVTMSFYARKGANFSPSAFEVQLRSGTGTDQNDISGFTGVAGVAASNPTLSTTWTRYTVTGTVAASATQLAVRVTYIPTGTAGAADYFEVTGVQVELGSTATTFSRAGGTIQGELAACQRYYWRTTSTSTSGAVSGLVTGLSATAARGTIKAPVTMRVRATSLDWTGTLAMDSGSAFAGNVTAITLLESSPDYMTCEFNTAAGMTQYRPYFATANSTATAYLGFSAEL